MWKRDTFSFGNVPQLNQDSDQSISEEDEEGLDGDWIQHSVSVGAPVENKGGVQVMSQLEKLADAYKREPSDATCISSPESKPWFRIDDEVEDPLFNDEDGSTHHPTTYTSKFSEGMMHLPKAVSLSHSNEEIVSDDEKLSPSTLDCAKKNMGGCSTWSQASREVEALDILHKNSHCSISHGRGVPLRETRSSKAGDSRIKGKPKPLFHFQSRQKCLSSGFNDGNGSTPLNIYPLLSEVGTEVPGDTKTSVPESQLILHEEEHRQLENIRVPSELGDRTELKEHSMAEFLDCFRERSVLHRGSLETDGGKRERRLETMLHVKAASSGDRNIDDYDDPLEAIESGPFSSSEDEENPQNLKLDISRSMADQFLEVYGTMSRIDYGSHLALPIPSSSGLFGKLQQVVQREKERDTSYLKSLSTGASDESMCISVRILSRSLEAKLTVCSCSCLGDGENSYSEIDSPMAMKSSGRNSTIIFSPKICPDIELEVGNLIRIHPPWKEVQVKGRDEAIILCSYFSQINC